MNLLGNGKTKCYTIFIASSSSWRTSRVRISIFAVQGLALLAGIGVITVIAGMSSYLRMVWKAKDYNSLREQQSILRRQYGHLRARLDDTEQRLDVFQSLATDMTTAYGTTFYWEVPSQLFVAEPTGDSNSSFRRSVEEFEYLQRIPFAPASGADPRLLSMSDSGDLPFVPSLWPVQGRITAYFGERLDPFSGEGSFHTGIDIASHYGDEVRASAKGSVVFAGQRPGYGNLVVIDHGFGVTSWYAHLSRFKTQAAASVRRGDVIGYEGQSGRATGPHLHYEIRVNNEPVNPWRYLRKLSIPRDMESDAAD